MTKQQDSRQIYKPTKSYSLSLPPGCSCVERWEIVGKRVYVEYTDGLVAHSELTQSELRAMAACGLAELG